MIGIVFWNVAALGNKDREFWTGLEKWDVMILMKTWVERKDWDRVRDKLPEGYGWRCQEAKRRSRRGRAMERIIMEIKKELMITEDKEKEREEGIMMGRVKHGKDSI